jgi:hypothetical protein
MAYVLTGAAVPPGGIIRTFTGRLMADRFGAPSTPPI